MSRQPSSVGETLRAYIALVRLFDIAAANIRRPPVIRQTRRLCESLVKRVLASDALVRPFMPAKGFLGNDTLVRPLVFVGPLP